MGSETRILGGSLHILLLLSTFIIGIQSFNSKLFHDADLVFDDSSSNSTSGASDQQAHHIVQRKKTINRNIEDDSLFDLGNFDDNTVAVEDDDIDAFGDEQDDDDEMVNEDGTTIAVHKDEGQSWLVRSVHRIKRSIDNLINGSELPVHKNEEKKTKKPRNGKKKLQKHEKNSKNKHENQVKNEKKEKKPKKVSHTDDNKKRNHQKMLRLKRQYEGLTDDEDTISGSGGHTDGFEFEYAYKLTLTVFEAYDPEFEDKESNLFKQIAKDVAEKLHALLSDLDYDANFIITVHKLEPNSNNPRETFVTFEINVDKSITRAVIDNYLRSAIQNGYENFDIKGYSLTAEGATDEDYGDADYHDAGPDKPLETFTEKSFVTERAYTLSSLNNSDDDNLAEDENDIGEPTDRNDVEEKPVTETEAPTERSTHEVPNTEDKCRGDDKFRCETSNVLICEVQKCDGHRDCPNGEDEINCSANCRDDEFSCDQDKCISKLKLCDNVRDCEDGSDEQNCPTTLPPITACCPSYYHVISFTDFIPDRLVIIMHILQKVTSMMDPWPSFRKVLMVNGQRSK
ncbi:basement membrane-specific heparan sulfate proteoglycan core protein-like [Toxorhynchites rutilus septentrionalis]|uniref:basement membrane-specific heparan sulfate proteoglycan core protein-like n=1 Tax=Toxorhynchites rutilus septentrionalis TaxID=329112 RepID=UPI0024784880|nr:basement membrane-specific heparan sulfate proteoglycan core protein-like [Toxorhynchites rutilus septentrionalis]